MQIQATAQNILNWINYIVIGVHKTDKLAFSGETPPENCYAITEVAIKRFTKFA